MRTAERNANSGFTVLFTIIFFFTYGQTASPFEDDELTGKSFNRILRTISWRLVPVGVYRLGNCSVILLFCSTYDVVDTFQIIFEPMSLRHNLLASCSFAGVVVAHIITTHHEMIVAFGPPSLTQCFCSSKTDGNICVELRIGSLPCLAI